MELGANISMKMRLHSQLDKFLENCGDISGKQSERFQQDIKVKGKRYQGRWDK